MGDGCECVCGLWVHGVCQLTLLRVWACVFVKVHLCVALICVCACEGVCDLLCVSLQNRV